MPMRQTSQTKNFVLIFANVEITLRQSLKFFFRCGEKTTTLRNYSFGMKETQSCLNTELI